MKYRLVKKTLVSGCELWQIEKRFLCFWIFLNSYLYERTATEALTKLRAGEPLERKEVLPV